MSPARQNPCKHGFFRYFRIAEDFMTPHANPVLHCRYATRKPGPPIRRWAPAKTSEMCVDEEQFSAITAGLWKDPCSKH